ncbi:PREDICTED: uncharacterized protein LOC105451518 isoform X1 [Wasmannia auropunctata]|uniref:uncharacterized protein LOC105451518 isoform X1 n=1 Tax=Wasmannia auropunctata TaxID=64793 RepID=UPI0005EE778A|nr:PREDICTED: uncharacterized protein LOC105451518 isoform X1 [Wasmannia auropunctata]
MFSQRPCYFSQLSRSHPILKLVDIYDRQSFIRAYVLDNFYVCILMYILFYVTLWYANNIIKRIEKSNREMSTTVAENKTKLDRLVLLRNKKAEFEKVIVKTTDAQKVTTKHLEDEIHRLSTELITTTNKITGLEKVVEKMVFSTNTQANYLAQPALSKVNVQKNSKEPRARSRCSRFSNRHFHRLYHRNLRLGSTGSLSVDRLGSAERRLQLHLQLHRQRSDSSNSASAEASSESVNQHPTNKILSRYNYHDGDRKRHPKWLSTKTRLQRSSCYNMRKIHMDSLKNVTPFTKSLLGLATIFLHGHP